MKLARGRGRRALYALAVPALLVACVSLGDVDVRDSGFSDERTQVQVLTTQIGGKNVFVPSTILVTSGVGRSLSFFNTTDQPHGMAIPGLGIEVILKPGEEYVVELPTLEGGRIYAINCHLHPPHRSATLVVLPGR